MMKKNYFPRSTRCPDIYREEEAADNGCPDAR